MVLVDSHCHLADDAFAGDAHAAIERARAAGLAHALCILDADSDVECERAAALAREWDGLRFAVGIHPHHAGAWAGRLEAMIDRVRARVDSVPGVRAIGEIGLDYHYTFAPREVQRAVFAAQLRLAQTLDLPVVIHTREADLDTLAAIDEAGAPAPRGVFHCFTGPMATAEAALARGFHVSLAGIVTFAKADALREVARAVPADRLLVETDSPYLAPVPHRGKRNEPALVRHVAAAVASARGVADEVVAAATTRNFAALFRP